LANVRTQAAADLIAPVLGDAGLVGKPGPAQHAVPDLLDDVPGAAGIDRGGRGTGGQVGHVEPLALGVDRHLVPRCPVAIRVVRPGDVERRRQRPLALPVHQVDLRHLKCIAVKRQKWRVMSI
jgi:hypothetical protein